MTGVAARGVSTGSAGKARRPRSRRSPPPPVEGQRWDPIRFARNARFVTELGLPLVELLNPLPGEHILDLGCGDGALTEYLAALGACVVGVDASPEQIAAARGRGVDARLMDGASLDLPPLFDAVFSNAALHWMRRADAVIEGVWRVLKPGGRFMCLEFSRVSLPVLDRLYDAYSFAVLPTLGRFIAGDAPAYRYLAESIRRFPSQSVFASMIGAAGLRRVAWRNLSGGIAALHSAWRI